MRRLLFLALVLAAGSAHASWYYQWSCSGSCAPHDLAIKGAYGPYASQSECEYAGSHSSAYQTWNEDSTSLFVAGCREYAPGEAPPERQIDVSPMRLIGFGGFFDGGPGWTALDPGRANAAGASTMGFDIELHGGNVWFGALYGFGLKLTEVHASYFRQETQPLVFWNVDVGILSTPPVFETGSLLVRPRLSGAFEVDGNTGCSICGDDFPVLGLTARASAGVEVFFGDDKVNGIALEVVLSFLSLGDVADPYAPSPVQLNPPTFLLRIGYVGRDPNWG